MKDLIQECGKKLTKPEIRVWCHPKSGKSDYYYTFKNLAQAGKFIADNQTPKKFRVEDCPLIAYDGYELTVGSFRKKYPKKNI